MSYPQQPGPWGSTPGGPAQPGGTWGQSPYPTPPRGPQPGMPGQLPPAVLDLRITQPLSMGFSMAPLNVFLNGVRQAASMGDNRYLLPPGRHHLEASVSWIFGQYGKVSHDFIVEPGQHEALQWAIPYMAFNREGALGRSPQKSPGLGCLFLYLGVILAVVVGAIVVGLLLAMGASS